MISKNYICAVLDVSQYLLSHKDVWFMENELRKIAPRYFKKIVDKFIDEEILFSTKDGLLFDDDGVDALNSYLSELVDNMPEEEEVIDKIKKITGIVADVTTIGTNIIRKDQI